MRPRRRAIKPSSRRSQSARIAGAAGPPASGGARVLQLALLAALAASISSSPMSSLN